MKALLSGVLLTAVALVATPPAVEAASITFTHRFHETTRDFEPGSPNDPNAAERVSRGLSTAEFGWVVPEFDPALGTLEVLLLDLDAGITVWGRTSYGRFSVIWDIYNPLGNRIAAGPVVFADCSQPCAFLGGAPVIDSFYIEASNLNSPFAWNIGYSPDKFATFPIGAWADIATAYIGVARATYVYEPATVAAVPEPTTLLLLASGLGTMVMRRRKR